MRNRKDDNDLSYYDGFTNLEDVFDWNLKIENTLKIFQGVKMLSMCPLN